MSSLPDLTELTQMRDQAWQIAGTIGPKLEGRKARRMLANLGIPADAMQSMLVATAQTLDHLLVLLKEVEQLSAAQAPAGLLDDTPSDLLS
ncbi:hypothetical protein [Oceanibaculum sp.]|uniref:hypothetical protein n=1 Tax=Oceanibaculum sp. TaxID=1903597 RepID=UPI00258D1ADE|nr:hypothetical protein [Oceanibaculum sp.]MCH2393216.1 hypothetical protein [Oceanibaculum sp.]